MVNEYEVVTMSESHDITKTKHVDFYDALKVYEEVINDKNIIKCKLQVISRTILFEQERGE